MEQPEASARNTVKTTTRPAVPGWARKSTLVLVIAALEIGRASCRERV